MIIHNNIISDHIKQLSLYFTTVNAFHKHLDDDLKSLIVLLNSKNPTAMLRMWTAYDQVKKRSVAKKIERDKQRETEVSDGKVGGRDRQIEARDRQER